MMERSSTQASASGLRESRIWNVHEVQRVK